jgi:hypothetical protein
VIIGTAGTGGSAVPDPPATTVVDPTLVEAEDCSADLGALRSQALSRMKSTVDTAYVTYVFTCFPQDYRETVTIDGGAGRVVTEPPRLPGEGPTDFTGTNNQVLDVDEADFIKTDGDYFYVASGGGVRIIDAWPAEDAAIVSELAVPGEARQLFVHDDRMLVYARAFRSTRGSYAQALESLYAAPCTYGYDCDFRGDGSETWVGVYDVSDRTAPVLEREIRLSGSLLAARRIGGVIHTLTEDGARLPDGRLMPERLASFDPQLAPEITCDPELGYAQVTALFKDVHDANAARISAATRAELLPQVEDTAAETPIAPCSAPLVPVQRSMLTELTQGSPLVLLTLASFDLESDQPVSVTSLESPPGASYATPTAWYIGVRDGVPRASGVGNDVTLLHKLSLDGARAEYAGSGVAKGRVLNQFALDELDGVLRIAATTGFAPNPQTHSTVTLLREQNGRLNVVGTIDQLAPSEDIRSVRFQGAHGFVVTFKKTDPLFVLDLADPANPRVLAELKVPGFSTYIHPVDPTRLLTVGYDADDQGSFAFFTGVRLQLFDVESLGAPRLVDAEIIGTRGSSSEALVNHLAFTFARERGLLGLPLTICENATGAGSFGQELAFSGLGIYRVSESGLELLGRVAHPPGTAPAAALAQEYCYSWWTDASSAVKRSYFFDDYVYSASEEVLKANALDDLDVDVSVVPLVPERE